jgi:hypothetical protein
MDHPAVPMRIRLGIFTIPFAAAERGRARLM